MTPVAPADAATEEAPIALRLEPLTTLEVTVGDVHEVGELPHGGLRRVMAITGGTMHGPHLRGTVLPGGADWNTQRGDGTAHVWARYTIRTADDVVIGVVNSGVITGEGEATAGRTAVTFDAPVGPYAWLNDSIVVGSLALLPDGGGVRLRFHRVVGEDDA